MPPHNTYRNLPPQYEHSTNMALKRIQPCTFKPSSVPPEAASALPSQSPPSTTPAAPSPASTRRSLIHFRTLTSSKSTPPPSRWCPPATTPHQWRVTPKESLQSGTPKATPTTLPTKCGSSRTSLNLSSLDETSSNPTRLHQAWDLCTSPSITGTHLAPWTTPSLRLRSIRWVTRCRYSPFLNPGLPN